LTPNTLLVVLRLPRIVLRPFAEDRTCRLTMRAREPPEKIGVKQLLGAKRHVEDRIRIERSHGAPNDLALMSR
jgi:hypothetical protein